MIDREKRDILIIQAKKILVDIKNLYGNNNIKITFHISGIDNPKIKCEIDEFL